jgi:hypothetical protein
MDARVRESQIERGWLAHEPDRAKVPLEVWRNKQAMRSRSFEAASMWAATGAIAR